MANTVGKLTQNQRDLLVDIGIISGFMTSSYMIFQVAPHVRPTAMSLFHRVRLLEIIRSNLKKTRIKFEDVWTQPKTQILCIYYYETETLKWSDLGIMFNLNAVLFCLVPTVLELAEAEGITCSCSSWRRDSIHSQKEREEPCTMSRI